MSEKSTLSKIGRSLCFAAALSFAGSGLAQLPSPSDPYNSLQPPAAGSTSSEESSTELQGQLPEAVYEGVPATDEELQQAQGGLVWVLVYYGAVGTTVVLRACAPRVNSCVRGAAAVFTSARAARNYACRRWGRLC